MRAPAQCSRGENISVHRIKKCKMHEAIQNVVQTLRSKLIDPSTPIAAKWRALFALRNIAGSSAEDAMIDGMKANMLHR